jgi:hypothetical protein
VPLSPPPRGTPGPGHPHEDFLSELPCVVARGTDQGHRRLPRMPSRKQVNARTPLATPADTDPVSSGDSDVTTAPCTPLSVPSSPSSISTQNDYFFFRAGAW